MSENPKYQNQFNFNQEVGNVNAGDTTIKGNQIGIQNNEVSEKANQPKQILILAANPTDTKKLRLDKEVREIEKARIQAEYREQIKIIGVAESKYESCDRVKLGARSALKRDRAILKIIYY